MAQVKGTGLQIAGSWSRGKALDYISLGHGLEGKALDYTLGRSLGVRH